MKIEGQLVEPENIGVMRAEVQVNGGRPGEGDDCWHQMGVDVDGLIVPRSQALEASPDRLRGKTKASQKEAIVVGAP